MSEFVLTGSDVFGRYCLIEQLRFYAPNEMYLYKVIKSLRSNCWCDVPYKTASREVLHDSIEDCVLAIRCGVDETEVLRFRTADVEFVPEPICDRDRLGGGYYWKLGKGGCAVMVKNGERIKRPAVLAADGKPLEVGQTVWHVDNGIEFTVATLPKPEEYQAVKLRLDDGSYTGLDPDQLTHQRPVLDADGVPIDEGDTVWNATTSAGPFTVREIERSDDPDEPEDIVWCGEHAANGFKVWRIAGQLTHTKPEPDSWSSVWADVSNGNESPEGMMRRCRALAERERSE